MTKEKITAVVHEEFTVDFTEHGMCRPRIEASIERIIARILTRLLCAAPPAPPAEEKPRDRAEEMAEKLVFKPVLGPDTDMVIGDWENFPVWIHGRASSIEPVRKRIATALRAYADEVLEKATREILALDGLIEQRRGHHDACEILSRLKSSAPKP